MRSLAEGVLAGKYVKVQVLSVLDTLMTTTYWLVATLALANTASGSVNAVVLAVSVASLLRPIAEPPTNHGFRFLLRTYMGLGRKGVVRFGKLYWSSVALNALLSSGVGTALLVSWVVTRVDIFLWASMLAFSSTASLPAQLPALLFDDAPYFRIVLLSNFVRYALLYIMWRGAVSPQPCFESFLAGSLLALAAGIGYAAWRGVGPRAWDASEVRGAMRVGAPAWLEGVGTTIAKWGVLATVAIAARFGLVSPSGPYYIFTAFLIGNIIAALLGEWVNVVLLARSGDQHLLPVKVVGVASGMAFPFATYFTLSTLHSTADAGTALLAGALLASMPIDLLGSLLSSRAYTAMVPGGIRVLRVYALAQFLAPVITYGVYLGLVVMLGRALTAIALPYLAIRLLSLMISKSMSRAFLQVTIIIVAMIVPLLICVGLAFSFPTVFSNVLWVTVLSAVLASLNGVLTNIFKGHSGQPSV